MRKSIILQLKTLLFGHNWIKYNVYLFVVHDKCQFITKITNLLIDSKTESIDAMHREELIESINTMAWR